MVDQLVVAALLHDAAVVDDDDAVSAPRGGETVRDEDRRAPVRGETHRPLDPGFGAEVEVRGGLVEQQDRRIDEPRARGR